MIGLLALAVVQKPVTMPPRAMRLDSLLKELSSQSGATYKASAPLIGRIVFVAGPPRPAADLCKELAAATWGKWRQVGSDWILDEDREAVTLRERRRLAGRIEQVKKQQDDLRTETAKPFDEAAAKALLSSFKQFDDADKRNPNTSYPFREKSAKGVPANQAIRRIAASIDPVELASLEVGTTVYSNIPTRLQRPLPQSAANAIRQLERDQSIWSNVYPDNSEFMESHRSTGWSSMDPRGYTEPVPAGRLRLVLKIQTFEYGQTLFSGNFVDKTGKLRQFGEFSLEFRDGRGREDPAPKVDPKEPKIVLPPAAKAFSETRRGKPMSPVLQSIALHPESREPLDLLIGEGLRGVAKARKSSVVAWLGDDAINFTDSNGESAGEWLRDLWGMNYEVRETPGSFVIRPRFEPDNVDRTRMGTIVRIADAKGFMPLDDLAEYAAASTAHRPGGDMLSQVWLGLVTPGLLEASRIDWKMLSLWGGFTRSQRQVLMKRGLIPWTEIGKPLRDRLVEAVLKAESHEIRSTGRNRSFQTLDQEPTEILANGFKFGEGVMGDGSAEEGVYAPSNDENPYNGGMASPWTLARAMIDRERKPNDPHYDGLPKELPTEFRSGTILRYGFRIDLSDLFAWQKSAQYGEFDVRSRPIPVEAMPESFQKAFERAMETIRKQPSNG